MLLRKFFIGLCLTGVLNVSAEPVDANWQEILQLRQQLDQLRDVLLDQEDKISQQQKELQKLRGDNEVLVHKIDQVQKQQQDIFLDMDKRLQAIATPAVPESPVTTDENAVANQSAEKTVETSTEKKSSGEKPVNTTPATTPPVAKTVKNVATSTAKPAEMKPVEVKPADTSALAKETVITDTVKEKQGAEVAETVATPPLAEAVETPVVTEPKTNDVAPTATQPFESEESQYQKLMKLVDEGHEQQAAAGFEAFLQQYPQGKYSDNAQYWLGESYYASGDYASAIRAFNALLVTYPESPKYPHALLKIAFSHYELKEFARARELLQQVRNNYIGTSASRLAERRLKKMTIEGY